MSVPVRELQVKAEIARRTRGEIVSADVPYRVFGAAWSESQMTRVELSTDGGKSWQEAKLLGSAEPFIWRLWDFVWHPKKEAAKWL